MEKGSSTKRRRSLNVTGLDEAQKRPYLGPDFSGLPTHLPGTSVPFAPAVSSHPMSSFASLVPSLNSELVGEPTTSKNWARYKADLGSEPHEETKPSIDSSHDSKVVSQKCVTQIVEPPALVVGKEPPVFIVEKEPVFIEGMSIALQTEEDIARWIAERRRKWPTRENVEMKLQERKKEKETTTEKAQQKEKEEGGETEHAAPKTNTCRFFARNGRCKFGNKCRSVHKSNTGPGNAINTTRQGQETSNTRKMINGVVVNIPQRYKKEVSGAGSLFTKLVQKDLYQHENNVIIDFLQYLESKGKISKNTHLS